MNLADLRPKIIVFGIGGAGCNAVDNMIELQLQGVEFVAANTDAQALARSKAELCIQLGPQTTSGLGAGARPEVGAEAAEESIEEISKSLEGANMVFIAAGMGGGTGTGGAPIVARIAKEKGILTVGVTTKPFGFEHARRMEVANNGLAELRKYVDTLIVVPNQNLFRLANERTPFSEAFRMVDDVLYSGVRGITDLMVMPGLINLDFADVCAVMSGMGTAMMGMGEAEGEGRALAAARAAIDNPLLDDVSLKGARGVLINVIGGYDMTLFELDEAANEIRSEVAADANVIVGSNFDETLDGKIRISVVAAGLDSEAYQAEVKAEDPAPAPNDYVAPIVITEQKPDITDKHMRAETPKGADYTPTSFAPDQDPPHEDAYGGHLHAAAEPSADPDQTYTPPPTLSVRPEPATVEARPVKAEDMPLPPERPSVQPTRPVSRRAAPAASKATAKPAEKPASRSKSSGPSQGFGSLFSWGKNEDSAPVASAPPAPEPPEAKPVDAPKAPSFDDEDLEIPAFLRRSANR